MTHTLCSRRSFTERWPADVSPRGSSSKGLVALARGGGVEDKAVLARIGPEHPPQGEVGSKQALHIHPYLALRLIKVKPHHATGAVESVDPLGRVDGRAVVGQAETEAGGQVLAPHVVDFDGVAHAPEVRDAGIDVGDRFGLVYAVATTSGRNMPDRGETAALVESACSGYSAKTNNLTREELVLGFSRAGVASQFLPGC